MINNLIQCIVKLVGKLLVLPLVHSVHRFHHPFHGTSERQTQNNKPSYVDSTQYQRMLMNVGGGERTMINHSQASEYCTDEAEQICLVN